MTREQELERALRMLYDEQVEYITVNNLGDPHHNLSMCLARVALLRGEPKTALQAIEQVEFGSRQQNNPYTNLGKSLGGLR